MTEKEKAKELVDKFHELDFPANYEIAKQCALICLYEIIKDAQQYENAISYHNRDWHNKSLGYWQQVKTEIENL